MSKTNMPRPDVLPPFQMEEIKDFRDRLTPKAQRIYDTKVTNMIEGYKDHTGKTRYMKSCYIQKTVEWDEGLGDSKEIRMEVATQWLARFFNHAVENGVIHHGVLCRASMLELVSEYEFYMRVKEIHALMPEDELKIHNTAEVVPPATRKRALLMVWPMTKLDTATPKDLSALVGETGFYNEGEISMP